MDRKLKIGVSELVEFCCRDGDLGYDSGPGVNALQGLQTHQAIQRRYRDQAEAEYRVKLETSIDNVEIELGGRIDLLFEGEYPPRIEEIKTVNAHIPGSEDDSVFWGQLQVYGAAYARARKLNQVRLSLNLVNLYSRHEQRHERQYQREELESFVEELLCRYLSWHKRVSLRQQQVRAQAQAMEFPYPEFRPQQRYFAAGVYRCIREQQKLIVEAPTGSGKTISTLFPSVKALGEDLCDQIIYLSAKVSGQQQAVDAVERLPGNLTYLVIQAKARSCPCNQNLDEVDDEGRCMRCLKFFDRLPAAREELLDQGKLDVSQIQTVARDHRLCPFELSLQMLPWIDIVIADFNYVFDPLVQLTYFKNDSKRKVLLVDELHNLVDRARGMYSASLSRKQIRQAMDAPNSSQIDKALRGIRTALDRELRAQDTDESISDQVPENLLAASQQFSEKLAFDIFGNKRIPAETVDFSKAIFRFQAICQLFATHHRSLGFKPVDSRELKLLCLNAFEYLHDCYPMFSALIGFSATLSPADFFQRALGLEPDCKILSLESAFPSENLQVCVADYVDTRYRERENSIDTICESIARTYRAQPGNYLVFFTSYFFMQQVHEHFADAYPDIDTRLQQRDDNEAVQQEFVAGFFEQDNQLGFAIMGGRFAEGIDYQGEALIGAIVVGLGLPQPNSEQQLIHDDFVDLELDGFDYAYRFPGLIRVLQSAGRVIRSEQDRGVVILLDRRFGQSGYARYLPRHWQPRYCNHPEVLEKTLDEFWQAERTTTALSSSG